MRLIHNLAANAADERLRVLAAALLEAMAGEQEETGNG